jgi:hypothetical protein
VTVSRRCSFFIFQEALADLSIKELGFWRMEISSW